MCRYKTNGNADSLKIIKAVPHSERLPQLANLYGKDKITAVLSKAIGRALSNLNLRVGMNSDQIVELSFMLIESAEEDQLSIQDILAFLEGLVKSKYGRIYDRMDIPTFFDMLEKYREERHQSFISYKHEQDVNFKAMGDNRRTTDIYGDAEKDKYRTAMNNYLMIKKD
jgi:hypothetical protein